MPSRYICEIHDDIDKAVKVGRIDLIKGLTEEARVAGKRMEAKLQDYSSMKYDVRHYKKLKARIKQLTATEEYLDANLDLENGPVERDDSWPCDEDDSDC
jgi:hypothetical protein